MQKTGVKGQALEQKILLASLSIRLLGWLISSGTWKETKYRNLPETQKIIRLFHFSIYYFILIYSEFCLKDWGQQYIYM
jgi:hypothetical protein